MKSLSLSLAPDGDLRLHLPSGRHLDVAATEEGVRSLVRILRDNASGVRDQPGYIGEFPTQHVVNAWLRQDAARKQAEAKERAEAEAASLGINLDELDISL